jgi:membrane-associated phospholipid phosphatase
LLPTDILTILYLSLTGVLVLFHPRLPQWPFLILAHIAAICLIYAISRVRKANLLLQFIGDWIYVPAFIPIYRETGILNRIFHNGYLDSFFIKVEGFLFRGQPSLYLSQAFGNVHLSEFLHISYATYYLQIPALGLILYGMGILKRDFEAFRIYLFTIALTFYVCYLGFILFPVEGPFYRFPKIEGEISTGTAYKLAHRILDEGAARGAAFPSAHVAVAVVMLVFAWRYEKGAFLALSPLILGLILGTVFCRFHYAVDGLAGAIIGGISSWVGPKAYRSLRR